MKFWPIWCKRKWHVTHAVHGSCFKNKTKQNSMYTCFPDLCHFPQLSWGKSEGTKESWSFCCLLSEKFILHCVRVRVKDTSSPRIISGPVSRTTSSGPSFRSHSLNTLSPASFRCHKSQGIRELRRHGYEFLVSAYLGTFLATSSVKTDSEKFVGSIYYVPSTVQVWRKQINKALFFPLLKIM